MREEERAWEVGEVSEVSEVSEVKKEAHPIYLGISVVLGEVEGARDVLKWLRKGIKALIKSSLIVFGVLGVDLQFGVDVFITRLLCRPRHVSRCNDAGRDGAQPTSLSYRSVSFQ
jgi:hypothetical protein